MGDSAAMLITGSCCSKAHSRHY